MAALPPQGGRMRTWKAREDDLRARRGRAPAVALAALALLSAAACGCAASTPQSAVREFISARIAGDEAGACELTVEGDLDDHQGGEPYLHGGGVSIEIAPTRAEGDLAVVMVSFRWDGQSVEVPYVTRKVGWKWKVDLAATQRMWLPEPVVPEP